MFVGSAAAPPAAAAAALESWRLQPGQPEEHWAVPPQTPPPISEVQIWKNRGNLWMDETKESLKWQNQTFQVNKCLNVFTAVAKQLKIPHWGCPSWFYWAGPSGAVCADWDSEGAAHIPIILVVPGGIEAHNSKTNDAACKTVNNIGITLNHFSSALCSSSTNKSVNLSKNSHSSEQFRYSTYINYDEHSL